jgi:Zn-dependent M28 family amino/carboxypeptidase
VLPGVGDLADEIIVIGSHYDHVGYGYFGSRMGAAARGKLHPGADDNASGTSGNMLAARRISEALKALPEGTPRRTVLFLAFCAEESGLNGSRHYVLNPIAELKQHALMLNMDMIGRLRDTKLELGGVGTGEGLKEFLEPYVNASGLTVAMKKSGQGPSDHASFASAGVPALFFFTGLHDQYHAPTDTPDTINVEGAVQVADLVARITIDAATRETNFPFTSPTGGLPGTNDNASPTTSMGSVKVRFGVAPGDYSGEEDGVLIGDVSPGLPADKAGLKAGDLMVEWDGHKLRDVEGWMPLLAQHKPGDVVRITYVREGARLMTEATLVARGTPNQ